MLCRDARLLATLVEVTATACAIFTLSVVECAADRLFRRRF